MKSMNNALKQVVETGKELSKTLHALAAAEARASVAEARCTDLEEKLKLTHMEASEKNGKGGPTSTCSNEIVSNLHNAKEEIEKLREEAQINKDHMLQYKSIAQANEEALKQMEVAHENSKAEAEIVKKSLEAKLLSLRETVNELEEKCNMKSNEVAVATAGKEEAVAAVLLDITSLKENCSVKMSEIALLQTQLSHLKDDLEKEHKKSLAAQANYERQVILQSDTIQELNRTSRAVAELQEEASELRKSIVVLKTENNELKAKWETEKPVLEVLKNDADRKYNEVNELNKVLHSRLEALHIKLAEKDRHSSGVSGSTSLNSFDEDDGFQKVVKYLRRTKEIAEAEISLLKQEKFRLQSQLETALKAAETAQALLNTERTNSKAMFFSEEDFKSLQLQVREISLLRESNIQLREENRHNFEECQKLREAFEKARVETECLERSLGERQNEVEACRKEIEIQTMEKEDLKQRVDELLERSKNFDVEDYNRVRESVQQMQSSTEIQFLSGTPLEDLATVYLLAVESFQQAAQPVFIEAGAYPAESSSTLDATSAGPTMGQMVSAMTPGTSSPAPSAANLHSAKAVDDKEKKFTLSKPNSETRKFGRKLVRPRILKPEEIQGDVEMPEVEGSDNSAKPLSSNNSETQGNLNLLASAPTQGNLNLPAPAPAPAPAPGRKRPSFSSASELREELLVQEETAEPSLKKSKTSETTQDGGDGLPPERCDGQAVSNLEDSFEVLPANEISTDSVADLPHGFEDSSADADKDEVETARKQADEPTAAVKRQEECQSDRGDVADECLNRLNGSILSDEPVKDQAEQDIEQPAAESGSEREEGELVTDVTDLEVGVSMSNTTMGSPEPGELHSEHATAPEIVPGVDEDPLDQAMIEVGEAETPQVLDDDKNDGGIISEDTGESSYKLIENAEQAAVEIDKISEAAASNTEKVSSSIAVDTEEGRRLSPIRSSTTINLPQRAKERAPIRQAGLFSSSTSRGRGRAPRGRGGRGGRNARGQASGKQG